MKITLLYFDVYLCIIHCTFDVGRYFTGCRQVTRLGVHSVGRKGILGCAPTALTRRLHLRGPSKVRTLYIISCSPVRQPFGIRVPSKGRLPCSFTITRASSSFFRMLAPGVLYNSTRIDGVVPGSLIIDRDVTHQMCKSVQRTMKGRLMLVHQLCASPSSAPHANKAICAVRTIVRSVPRGGDVTFVGRLSVFSLGSSRKVVRGSTHCTVVDSFACTLLHGNFALRRLGR